jgi:hypothetical protein
MRGVRPKRSLRLLVRGLLAIVVMATGLVVVDERPAAAADPTPVLTVSGRAGCGPLDEAYTVITWTVSQDTFYGGEFTNVVISPADGLYGAFTEIHGTAAVVVSRSCHGGTAPHRPH